MTSVFSVFYFLNVYDSYESNFLNAQTKFFGHFSSHLYWNSIKSFFLYNYLIIAFASLVFLSLPFLSVSEVRGPYYINKGLVLAVVRTIPETDVRLYIVVLNQCLYFITVQVHEKYCLIYNVNYVHGVNIVDFVLLIIVVR